MELFAGGGGAAMGIHRAGVNTLARCEWDRNACATLRAAADAGHIDAAEVIEGDVRAVDWSPYAGRCDALWASPPCQAWSSAGDKGGTEDERNGWPWTLDVVDAVRPRWLIAENVVGMTHHSEGCGPSCGACYLQVFILPALAGRFAAVRWAVLDSADYGVPQRRRRLYIAAGPEPIRWPAATHGDPELVKQRGMFGGQVLPWRSIADALGHIGTMQAGIASSDTGARARPRATSAPAPAPAPALAGASRLYFRPAPTLTGGSARSHTNGRSVMSANKGTREELTEAGVRSYTVRECLRLMAWPDDYPLQGTKTSQYRIAANGCTPAVVELLCRAVGAITRA